MGEITYQDEFKEGGYTYGVQEELQSPLIKPFYLGVIIFAPTGKVPWQIPHNRCYYRIEPDQGEARIRDVVVEPQHQGKDIGRKLVEIAERRFRAHGITKVKGYAEPGVGGFWKKLGYRHLPNNDILKELS